MSLDPEPDPTRSATVTHVEDHPGVARLTIDRQPANAFDLEMYRVLARAILTVGERTPPLGCLLVGSAVPGFFSGGRDINEPSPVDESAIIERRDIVLNLYRSIYELPVPTIAVVDGYALGTGCVIASLCDIRIATPDARFGLPEIKAGSVGGARHLMRLLPQGTVRSLAFTGRFLDAEEALALGLVESVHPSSEIWEEAIRLASTIASFDADVTARTKRAMNTSESLSLWEGYIAEQEVAKDVAPRCAG